MAKYHDNTGKLVEVELTPRIYQEAHAKNISVESLINQRHPTREGDAPAFKQMCASLGLFTKSDRKTGIRATRIRDVMDGTGPCAEVSTNTRNDVPQSRILYQAAILSTIEDKLAQDLDTTANAFDRMVAVTENIEGTEFKRAILNYDRPEGARSQQVAQLARPVNMLTLTTSDRSQSIPTEALGIQWSDQAQSNVGLDIIALSVARQVAVQRDTRAGENVLAMLQGDADLEMVALSALNPSPITTASSLDGTSTGGKLSHLAWVMWLYKGRGFRQIDWIVTDIDGAMQIENRTGKPVITGDDPNSPRIDSQIAVANPLIPAKVNVFVTDHASWPSKTIMGIDSRYAIQRINSISSDYQATESDVIARSNTMRWDSGSAAMRLFDESFSVLTLS